MSPYDPAVAARVWQRVQAQTPAAAHVPNFPEMIAQEAAAATLYLQLSRQLKGSAGALLRRMAVQENTHAACLRGLCRMQGCPLPPVSPRPAVSGTPAQLLSHCYTDKVHALTRYETLAEDPQFRQPFSQLAAQERAQCQQLLVLLGNLRNGK